MRPVFRTCVIRIQIRRRIIFYRQECRACRRSLPARRSSPPTGTWSSKRDGSGRFAAWAPLWPAPDRHMHSCSARTSTPKTQCSGCCHNTSNSALVGETVPVVVWCVWYRICSNVRIRMFRAAVSAVTSTLIHDAISNPTEVIKQRLQMYNSPFKSIVQCARGVYEAEGIRAFYRSYSTQLIMNLPYQSIHFATYEFILNLVSICCVACSVSCTHSPSVLLSDWCS